ncbi:Centrosomal protein POC5-like [Oopsacas minuta]|uniref:Centrosomal protein POC5 n=1 Tax=Oopsacas minuta TaxID=111878 RepID=A0AAV7JNW1_9METZ|nr:Centrosomal protein POC5-like [Oopsacas minuta]
MDSSLEDMNMSIPILDESKGSSVSTTFREEYEELLKHTLIAPHIPTPLNSNYGTQTETVIMSPLKKQPDHSSEIHLHRQVPSIIPLPSEIAPEPIPKPATQFHMESDLIDLSLDLDELSKEPKYQTDTIPKHRVLQTNTDDVTEFVYDGFPVRKNVNNELSTDAIELYRINDFIDEWTGNFKRNTLAEVQQIQTRLNAKVRDSINRTREERAFEVNSLQRELESMRELVTRYEMSLSHRNQALESITRSLSKVRHVCNARKYWGLWRERLAEARGMALKVRLAEQCNVRRMKRRSWEGWRSLIVGRWKARIERACQARAQQVCTHLTADYELKVAEAENALHEAREEVKVLTRDRETYEETMKKAFMRGVCALSMEAMTMFQPQDIVPPSNQHIDLEPIPPDPPIIPEPPSTTQSAYIPIAKSQKKTANTNPQPITKTKEPTNPIYIQTGKRTNIAPSRSNKSKVLVERHVHVAH